MTHLFAINDAGGDLVELVYFCSDYCHRDWCEAEGTDYLGWNGLHELGQAEWCAECGIRCAVGVDTSCTGACLPIVVSVIGPKPGSCAHGLPHWIGNVRAQREAAENANG